MKYLSYGWDILLNIITLFVVVTVLGTATTRFESAVIAILIMIYLSITSFFTMYSRNTVNSTLAMFTQFNELKKQLKLEVNEYDEEAIAETTKKMEASNTKFVINSVASLLFYVIALFGLLGSL